MTDPSSSVREVWLVSGCGQYVVHSGGGGAGLRVRWELVQEGRGPPVGEEGGWWLRRVSGWVVDRPRLVFFVKGREPWARR